MWIKTLEKKRLIREVNELNINIIMIKTKLLSLLIVEDLLNFWHPNFVLDMLYHSMAYVGFASYALAVIANLIHSMKKVNYKNK